MQVVTEFVARLKPALHRQPSSSDPALEFVFWGQLLHKLAFDMLYVPTEQFSHEEAPACEYLPATQTPQDDTPVPVVNVPFGHGRHALDPASEYVPRVHAKHCENP
jgi:hypothetical protein